MNYLLWSTKPIFLRSFIKVAIIKSQTYLNLLKNWKQNYRMKKWHPDLECLRCSSLSCDFGSVNCAWFSDEIKRNRRVLFSHSFTPSSLVNAHFAGLVYTDLKRQLLLSDNSLECKVMFVLVFTLHWSEELNSPSSCNGLEGPWRWVCS